MDWHLPPKYDDYAESGFLITAKGNSEYKV